MEYNPKQNDREVKFSYCVGKCKSAQYFKLINNTWVCEECNTPLQKAVSKCTNVTQEFQYESIRV
jgi:hypothetical protein